MPLRSLLAFALVGSSLPGLAGADILVTRDGERIETKGAWRVEGRRVVYTNAQGTLSAIRTSHVDLEKSQEATDRQKNPPPPPPRPQATGPLPTHDGKGEAVLRLSTSDVGKSPVVFKLDRSKIERLMRQLDERAQQEIVSEMLSLLGQIKALEDRHDTSTVEGVQRALPELSRIVTDFEGRAERARPEARGTRRDGRARFEIS